MSELEDTSEATISVLDMPLSATAEEVAILLNEACSKGLYVNATIPWPGVGIRLVLRRYAVKPATPAKVGLVKPERVIPPTREDNAIRFLRDNREMSATALSAAFKALGFPRSPAWVREKRAEIIRAERRIS